MHACKPPATSRLRLALLCGGFPPQLDGIGDYTWFLSQELARSGHSVQVLTSEPDKTLHEAAGASFNAGGSPAGLSAGFSVTRCFDPARPASLRRVGRHFRSEVDWLVVQYNPFAFGPRGFNPWLLEALDKLRRRTRLAVMFHETYVPCWPWKFMVMHLWQWPQFWALTRMADAIFISSERWAGQVRACRPEATCVHLPVGSNLPRCPCSKAEARRRLGIGPTAKVLGAFGTGHISKLPQLVGVAAQAVQRHFPGSMLLSVGTGGQTLRANCPGINLRDEGPLNPDEAALRIRAMDVMLVPFADGLSTRRGSAIAALQHGVPICSTLTRWTDRLLVDPPWAAIRFARPDQPDAFARNAVALLAEPPPAEEIQRCHDAEFGWPKIGERFVTGLA